MLLIKILFLLLFLFSAFLHAFEVKTPHLTAELSHKGAVITSLTVKGQKWLAVTENQGSFNDRIGQNIDADTQGYADTSKMIFNIKKFQNSPKGTTVTFSARVGLIPGLLMEKTYFFSAPEPGIKITYTFTNIGKSPLPLSLYTRAFFRCANGKTFYYQPDPQGVKPIVEGETSLPRKLPSYTFLAAADRSGTGLIITSPVDDTAGLMNWLFKGGCTQEFLSSQRTLAPGAKRVFRLECLIAENIPSSVPLKSLAARKLKGELPVQVDRMCGINRKAKLQFFRSYPLHAGKFMEYTFNRQPQDSWRSVKLPPGTEKLPIAVYPLENGDINTAAPMAFFRRGKFIIIKVPGLFPGRSLALNNCRLKDDLVFHSGLKAWFGPVKLQCRLLFDVKGGKEIAPVEDIPANGALIRNGAMEISLKGKPATPAYMPFALRRSNPVQLLKEGNNTLLRVRQAAEFNFFPEFRKEYHLKFRARSIGGQGLSRVFIQFFDKSGVYLQKKRLVALASQKTFGWKNFERSFYIPDETAFLRIYILNGQARGQNLDIDDLELTLQPESHKSISPKTIAREELTRHWLFPLELIEKISHENVTPHTDWFSPAAEPLKDILFLSGVGSKVTIGRRWEIVEMAQRHDMEYSHIPLILRIKDMVRAYSVYPTTFYPTMSDYTMECLKEIKKLPKALCFTGVDFKTISDPGFYNIVKKWQQQGVNLLFYRCSNLPRKLLGRKEHRKIDLPLLYPASRQTPAGKRLRVRFYRNGKSLSAVVGRQKVSDLYVPQEQYTQEKYNHPSPHSFDYPWWEYHYLMDLQILRHLAGIRSACRLVPAPGGFAVEARQVFSGTLEITVENLNREVMLKQKLPIKLAQGEKKVFPARFELPGGTFIANLRLLDTRSRVVDAGAVKVEQKVLTPLSIVMKNKDNMVPYPQRAEFTVNVPELPAGAKVEVDIFNQRREILFKSAPKAEKKLTFSAALPSLRTFLNYIRVRVVKEGKLLAAVTQEFSVPQLPWDVNEFYGFINPGGSTRSLKGTGFDYAITGDPRWLHIPPVIRNLRAMGIQPIPRRGDEKFFRPYRSDVKTDPVRDPCFSSEKFHTQLQKDTKFMVENCRMRYYDVNLLWSGDEMFLGRSVCYSPSCLAGFRKELKKNYSSIAALNKSWGSSFKSFSEVLPRQLEELKDKNKLGPWLDHKMYMTRVFAENFFGKARDELSKYIPNVKIGPTGTQKPGFGYNWHELMKYCRIAGYYTGVQTKVIHDLAGPVLLAGECGGGYTHGHLDYEHYNYNNMWASLLNGGNLAYHYYGCAINGDGSLTKNMRYFLASLKELKSGIGKLYLSAAPRNEVALLYSQPSLFAAMGSCGQAEWQNAQTSWVKLLDDLRISSCFINYEDLANKGVPRGFKAVVLPFAIALSDREIAALQEFVRKGGTVIADCNAGIFDEHGRKRSEKERREKLQFVKELGTSVARYSFVEYRGTGGEVSSAGSGDEKYLLSCRDKVRALLNTGKIFPQFKLLDSKGNEYGCTAKLRFDGETRIYGFHRNASAEIQGRFKESEGEKLTVTIPRPGHVYDIRNKKYLGFKSKWNMNLIPGKSLIYGVVPVKPESVNIELPGTAAPGSSVTVKVSVAPAKSAQLFRLTVEGPGGRKLPWYGCNFRAENGRGTRELFIPFNAPCGKYKVKVTHVLSNLQSTAVFEVR